MASADRNPATALPIQALQGTHPACYARPGETFSEAEENVICSLPRAVRAGERVRYSPRRHGGGGGRVMIQHAGRCRRDQRLML
jgi:hypothetical protein